MLYKDEYEFASKDDENLFDEEQRKLKSIRRKQYENKSKNIKLDVTIFSIEKFKENLIAFLDIWFETHS